MSALSRNFDGPARRIAIAGVVTTVDVLDESIRATDRQEAADQVSGAMEDVLRHHGLEVHNGDRANGGVRGRVVTKGAVSE